MDGRVGSLSIRTFSLKFPTKRTMALSVPLILDISFHSWHHANGSNGSAWLIGAVLVGYKYKINVSNSQINNKRVSKSPYKIIQKRLELLEETSLQKPNKLFAHIAKITPPISKRQ